jgi:hypothetical protein
MEAALRTKKRESSMEYRDHMTHGKPAGVRATSRDVLRTSVLGTASTISPYLLAALLILVTLTGLLALGLHR